jgi:hypothetical protein
MAWTAVAFWLLSLATLAGATQLDGPNESAPVTVFVPALASNIGTERPEIVYRVGLTSEDIPADVPAKGVVTAQVVVTAAVAPLSGPEQLSHDQLRALLAEVGAPPEWVEDLVTIAWCESQGHPDSWNTKGEDSRGLWQLWVGWFRAAGFTADQWQDRHVNARTAVYVRETRGRYGGDGGWSCADLNGIY